LAHARPRASTLKVPPVTADAPVGGVEYLVGKADGHIYYYDVNATSNFVANALAVVGFDPTARFVDYIVRAAQGAASRPAASPARRPQTLEE